MAMCNYSGGHPEECFLVYTVVDNTKFPKFFQIDMASWPTVHQHKFFNRILPIVPTSKHERESIPNSRGHQLVKSKIDILQVFNSKFLTSKDLRTKSSKLKKTEYAKHKTNYRVTLLMFSILKIFVLREKNWNHSNSI